MNVAIIGAGKVGQALAGSLTKAGHTVVVGAKDDKIEKDQRELEEKSIACPVKKNRDAAASAEVIIFSTPWGALEEAIKECGELAQKIVIDCTNPLKQDRSGLEMGFDTSGAEQTERWAKGAHVFKTFNHAGAEVQADPMQFGVRPAMFICGDDPAGKAKVVELVSSIGFEAIDAGGLKVARLLEPLAMLWVHLSQHMGLGRRFAYGLLR